MGCVGVVVVLSIGAGLCHLLVVGFCWWFELVWSVSIFEPWIGCGNENSDVFQCFYLCCPPFFFDSYMAEPWGKGRWWKLQIKEQTYLYRLHCIYIFKTFQGFTGFCRFLRFLHLIYPSPPSSTPPWTHHMTLSNLILQDQTINVQLCTFSRFVSSI